MRLLFTAIATLLTALMTSSSVRADAPLPSRKRVMVLALTPIGVDPKLVSALPDLIAGEIGQHPEYDVASSDDVRRLLTTQQAKAQSGCAQDEACLIELSWKSDADLVVSGSVGQVGRSYVLNLVLFNPKTMSGSSRVSEVATRVEDLPRVVVPAVAMLFKWGKAAPVAAFHLPKGQKLSFAVFDLKPTGLNPDVVQNLTEVLSVEVKGIEGASVISHDDIASLLQFSATKMKLGCADDSCLGEIGAALGVDRLITGDAGKLGNLFIVSLRLLDVRRGVAENRVTESYEGDEEQLLRAVRHAARQLLGLPAGSKGQLAVTSSQNASTVFVDQKKHGAAPVLITALDPGAHEVRVARDRFFDWHGAVYVDPAETTSVWAQLNARPQAWYQKWWVWTITGVVVAGGATGIALGTRSTASLPNATGMLTAH